MFFLASKLLKTIPQVMFIFNELHQSLNSSSFIEDFSGREKKESGLIEFESVVQAAATTCYVATHPRLLNVSGKYFADCNEASTSKLGSSSKEAERLWSVSEIMASTDPRAVFDPLNGPA